MEKEVSDLARKDRSYLQSSQHLIKWGSAGRQETMACSYFLGEKFTELPKLDQNRGCIVKKETFRQGAQD